MVKGYSKSRARDIGLWLRAFMAERELKGLGPPEKAGANMMNLSDVHAYVGGSREALKRQLAALPHIKVDKLAYWHIPDIARWLVQKEMEEAS